jgi:predicted ATPase
VPEWQSHPDGCRGFAALAQPSELEADSDDADSFLEASADVAEGPVALYRKGREDGLYRKDPGQVRTVRKLQQLYDSLREVHPPKKRRPSGLTVVDNVDAEAQGSSGGGWWSSFVGSSEPKAGQEVPRGLYMYGGVGVGKTMLMDLLVASAPPEFKLRRAHFHDFMLDVHARLQKHRTASDALHEVADELAGEMRVLALDEFFVTDVADAVILNRLFSRMWELGVVLVSTSNRAPDALYEGGLQRVLFLPFIDRLKAHCITHDMEMGTDYRKLAHPRLGMFFTGERRDEELASAFTDLTNNQPVAPASISVQMGRKLHVNKAGGCICMLSFCELCGKPVAAADYIALAEHYHSVAISGVPVVTPANRPAAYRFMILIDVLYEHKIRLFLSAEAEPFELFENVVPHAEAKGRNDDGLVVDDNLGFTKDRTISRLIEMQSREYLTQHAEQHAPELLLALHDRKANPKSQRRGRHERGGLRSST